MTLQPLTDEQRALEILTAWLSRYHPTYEVNDLQPSKVAGYLKSKKPCHCTKPPFDGYVVGTPSGHEQEHYHTFCIEGKCNGFAQHFGRGKYAFWRVVCRAFTLPEGRGLLARLR